MINRLNTERLVTDLKRVVQDSQVLIEATVNALGDKLTMPKKVFRKRLETPDEAAVSSKKRQ